MTRPSELDWSDPQKTPRFDPSKASACREGISPPVQAPSRPLTDWFAVACEIVAPTPDQNLAALREAVRHYRQTYGRWAYEAMRDAAMRCGMPEGDPPLAWSTKRLRTFQNTMESA